MEIIFSPIASTGRMRRSASARGSSVEASIKGTLGPYTSASSSPILWPSFSSARARLTATVVLPTPPLPLATATRFFTPGMGWRSGIGIGTRTRRHGPLRERLTGALWWALVPLHLNVEEVADRLIVDARHHIFKQCEGFLLELDERILLPVAAQADAFFQVVERKQMVLPLRVYHIENDAALEPAHDVRADLRLFLLVAFVHGCDDCAGQLIRIQLRRISPGGLCVDPELRVRLGQKLGYIPLLRVLCARAIGFRDLARNIF